MTNTLIQKMACGESVYLTPQKEFVFQDKKFKSLMDCYAYELKKNEPQNTRTESWIMEMVKKCKENEKSKKV